MDVFDFSWNIVVIIVQSGLKLYDFTILAAGVETEKVCNPFAHDNGSIMCVFDRAEDRTNLNWRGNSYAAQKQDYCSEEH